MILYLTKFKDKDLFSVGVTSDLEMIQNNENYDLDSSCYYIGNDEDTESLSNIIHQLFKKYLVDTDFFDFNHFEQITEFIEYQANNYGFEISEKNSFEKKPETSSPQTIQEDCKIFCCFVYDEQNISISLKSSFKDRTFQDEYIDRDKSVIIKFEDTKDAKNFFVSLYLLTKSINNKIDGKNFTISSESVKQIQGLILNQARTLVGVMEYKLVSLSENKILDFGVKRTFTSDEVCNLLGIDRQKLAYWRKTGKIKFKKHSDKKFTYQKSHVFGLLEDMMIQNEISGEVVEIPKPKTVNSPKINSRLERLKVAQSVTPEPIPLVADTDYTQLIRKWASNYTYKVLDHKYQSQKFFLNFGNIGIQSSPQVMINDDYQLVDYIKKKVIKSNPKEVWEYILYLNSEGLEPRVDTSKKLYDGYKKLYLNELKKSIDGVV